MKRKISKSNVFWLDIMKNSRADEKHGQWLTFLRLNHSGRGKHKPMVNFPRSGEDIGQSRSTSKWLLEEKDKTKEWLAFKCHNLKEAFHLMWANWSNSANKSGPKFSPQCCKYLLPPIIRFGRKILFPCQARLVWIAFEIIWKFLFISICSICLSLELEFVYVKM